MSRESDRPFVGREDEQRGLAELLETHDLVTVVGAPGVGKSRLARVVVGEFAEDWLAVTLTDVDDGALFRRRLAETAETRDADVDTLVAALNDFDIVLLDDFDGLVAEAEVELAPLLAANVTWVVTSRERVRSPGEAVFALDRMTDDEAAELFADRARRTAGEFAPDPTTLLELVRLLDCNPLAIELAAARIRTFSPADLIDRLDRRFDLLRGGRGVDLPAMADALDRSWQLLDEVERDCLWQCSVFRGGFDLDAAEAVVRPSGDDSPWVLDVIEALIDRSLLERGRSDSGPGRLWMSHSIRDFVRGKRDDPERTDELRRRHAETYVALGARWGNAPWSAERLDRAAARAPNLLAVVERFATSDPRLAASAALALDDVFRYRGDTERHLQALRQGIAAARSADDDATLARLLRARAELGVVIGRLEEAADDASQAADLAGEDAETFTRAEVQRAEVDRRTGSAREALARLHALTPPSSLQRYVLAHRAACHAELGELSEARDIAMHLPPPDPDGDPSLEYSALKRVAYAHYYLGSYEHQHRLNQEALALAEQVGDRRRIARARQGLGDAAFARGDFEAVREHYEAALAMHRELGNDHLAGVLLGNLGSAEHRLDAFDDAAAHYEQSLTIHRQTGARPYEAVVTFALAVLEHEREHFDDATFRYDQAVELFGDLHQPDDVVATQIARAWLELLREEWADAERALDWAEVSAPEEWLHVIEGSRLLLASRRGDANVGAFEPRCDDDSLACLLAKGLASLLASGGDTIEQTDALSGSLQGRLLLNFARGRTGRAPTAAPANLATLTIGEGGAWFQLGEEEPVNLRRRRAHRLVLDRLMQIYEESPGTPLDVYDAFDVGWPGESATAETAAERVYWVVGTLRKLGLEGVLLTSDAGYYLDPGANVVRSDDQNE